MREVGSAEAIRISTRLKVKARTKSCAMDRCFISLWIKAVFS